MGKTKIQPSLARLQAQLGLNGQTVQQLDNCEWGAVRGKRLSNSTEQSYRRMCAGDVRLCRKQLSGTLFSASHVGSGEAICAQRSAMLTPTRMRTTARRGYTQTRKVDPRYEKNFCDSEIVVGLRPVRLNCCVQTSLISLIT
jgi:hypothetical protein